MINGFFGEYRFLSNFYPTFVIVEGRIYPTIEHAYQAMKSLDEHVRHAISLAKTPTIAKSMGRALEVRHDWDEVKVDVMRELLRLKFERDDLRALLMRTRGNKLINRDYWDDTFWGVVDGAGQNQLGNLLMELRNMYERLHDYS